MLGEPVEPKGQIGDKQRVEDVDADIGQCRREEVGCRSVHMAAHLTTVDGVAHWDHEDHGEGADNELVTRREEDHSEPIRDDLDVVYL